MRRAILVVAICLALMAGLFTTARSPSSLSDVHASRALSAQSGSTPEAAPTEQVPAGYFTGAADPLTISPELDAKRAAKADIPVAGGRLTATDAKGNRFTLTIPAKALLQKTNITMTPLTGAKDLPMSGGLIAGVLLEPVGLQLYDFATLRIVPAKAITPDKRVAFGFTGDKNELYLAPFDKGKAISIKLLHFSGAGVGAGTTQDAASIASHAPTSTADRLSQQMGSLLTEQAHQPDMPQSLAEAYQQAMDNLLAQYEQQVLQPLIGQATSSCDAGKQAIRTTFGYERYRQLTGRASAGPSAADQVAGLMPQILEKCKKENLDKCTAKDFKDRVTDLLGLERVSQLLGMSDETTNTLTQDLDQLKRKCGSFTVSGSARDFGSCKGTICALDKPFVVTCGTLTANFTPVGAAGGSMNFTGTGGGCTFTGSGSYIIGAPAGDDLFGYSLTFTTSSTTSCGGSATVGLTWNLAPIAPGSNTCS